MRRLSQLVLLSLLSTLAGCASLTASRSELLNVQSQPPGAQVRADGATVGTTPATIDIDLRYPPIVEVTMPGYSTETCRTRMSPGIGYVVADALLCLVLFPVGCIAFIDAGGAWNQLQNDRCYANLQPVAPPPMTGGL